jgi:tRNA-(ms[2]io[6]A)-hydroxylase
MDSGRARGDPARMRTANGGAAAAEFTLCSETPPSWGAQTAPHLHALLVDQAQLEKKAAAAANRFLFVLPSDAALLRALSQLAREELVHFERTLRLCEQRGIAFAPQPPCAYAERLKRGGAADLPQRLVDELLVAALIEARSCERMRCLADALPAADAEVAAFYRELCDAEARHHLVYVDAAVRLADEPSVTRRWRELARHEADVLASLPWTPHLHGGHGDAA